METRQRVYLASPYSDPDPEVRHKRYRSAVVATKALMLKGFSAFSPIVHGYALDQDDVLPSNPEFWMEQDFPWLESADALVVLPLPGWTQSRGVQLEIKLADSLNIPVRTFKQVMESQ